MKDVARVNLGSQVYNLRGRFNGQNAAILAIYQLPGSNAVDTMKQARVLMEQAEEAISRRSRLRRRSRHYLGCDRGDEGDRQNAV